MAKALLIHPERPAETAPNFNFKILASILADGLNLPKVSERVSEIIFEQAALAAVLQPISGLS